MKQVLLDPKTGDVRVADVPPPVLERGMVLVANRASLISTGTERAKAAAAEKGLFGKALARPDLVGKVLDRIEKEGVVAAWRAVKDRLERPIELGYSASGVVVEADAGAIGLSPGDRVACAGGGYALHAELVRVPANLAARLPEGVAFEAGAFAALGAIALQGVRRARAEVGETFAVVGLGLVGLLAIQVLRAAGCRAIGIDLDQAKVDLARSLGFEGSRQRHDPALEEAVRAATARRGLDGVLVTAESRSGDPLVLAGELVRERGRVVVVGGVRMDFDREPYYRKEVDLVFSRSYGPGRYDREFEEKGLAYPHAYVPWTEKRNMECFLDLVAAGSVRTEPLVTERYPVEEAPRAYARLTDPERPAVALVLAYADETSPTATGPRIYVPEERRSSTGLAVGFVGAGRFASQYLLPHLARRSDVRLAGLLNATGASVEHALQRFPFFRGYSSLEELLGDGGVDAVFIATRHDHHAEFVARALEAGKHVFVEKPPALDRESLAKLRAAVSAHPDRVFMVGFNRRFSPAVALLADHIASRAGPAVISVRVAAGPLPDDHWLLDPEYGGGRLAGEACHFVDLVRFLVRSEPVRVVAERVADLADSSRTAQDFALSVGFADGSLANLVYTSRGAAATGKERIEVFAGERTAILEDYRTVSLAEGRKVRTVRPPRGDKGHRAEVGAFVDACLAGGPSPVPPEESLAAMDLVFAATRSLALGRPVDVSPGA
ncbi:MAG: bi-domain-containing oxidoreductase [Planctomycetes bacterium]|nr:bi-domain-containing oxidoreductase [Planctomycetota bacterium]